MIDTQKNIDVDPALKAEMASWLTTEILDVQSARQELEDLWAEIAEMYDATELDTKKDWPFENAACLVVPVVPMMVETMKAKIFTTIFSPKDPFNVSTRLDELDRFVRTLRTFLTWSSKTELNLKERLDSILTEMLKLGTAVGKAVYTRETRRQKVWQSIEDDEGEWVDEVYVIRDSPEIIHPPLADIFFPLDTTDDTLDEAAFVAERFYVQRHKLERWKKSDKYDSEAIEKIMAWEDDGDESEVAREREQVGERPVKKSRVTLYEVWFDHEVADEGPTYKLVGYLHLPSMEFIMLTHGWFPYGLHPYEVVVHEKREHKVYGNGVGKIGTPFQQEVSTQHNQRIDAMTIANANAFKKKADSLLPEDIRIRPGATIPVDDMDDLQPLFTGQRYDSTIQEEQNTLALLRERVGLQEYSPDTLANAQSTTLTLALGESTRRFDQVVGRVRSFMSRLMMKVMLLYQKYYPEGKPFLVMGPKGQIVTQVMDFPESFIYDSVVIEVTATTSVTSAELERQNKLALFNLVTQAYGQISQYSMAAANPQAPPSIQLAALVSIEGICIYAIDVLDDYALSQSRELAAGFEEVKAIAGQQKQNIMAAGSGGAPGMAGLPGLGGEGVPAGAEPVGAEQQPTGGV